MLRRLLPLFAATLLLAGCGGDPAPAKETPAKQTPTTTAGQTARPTTAPAAKEPLDLGIAYRHPCAILTAAQQKQLGFQQAQEKVDGAAGRCQWANGYQLQLQSQSDVLADAYRDSNSQAGGGPKWAVFEPRQIKGLPALVRATEAHGGTCEVLVGAAPGQGVVITGNTAPGKLVNAAGLVVDTVRRWAGV